MCLCQLSYQLCPTLCDPMNHDTPGSSVHGIFQARMLEWVAMPSSRGPSQPRDQTCIFYISCIEARFTRQVAQCHLGSPRCINFLMAGQVRSVQFSLVSRSCPTLCNPMDCSTPSFPLQHQRPELTQTHVHRISDAIQPSHPLLSPSPPAFNLSQHQGLFK